MSLYGIKNILSNYESSKVNTSPLTNFWCNDYWQNMSKFMFNTSLNDNSGFWSLNNFPKNTSPSLFGDANSMNKYFEESFNALCFQNAPGIGNNTDIIPAQQNPPVDLTDFQDSDAEQLYSSLALEKEGLSYEVFAVAMKGYKNLNDKGNGMLGIVDPNSKKYYLIDLNKSKFVGKTDVKFGSGNMNTVAAANKSGSLATLSGFQKVAEEYNGKWAGGAKRIDGLESGINNNSRSKATVIHSTTKNTTWGCIGYTPVYKNGKVDAAATNEKMNQLFPKNTILFTYPTNLDEYSRLSALV